MPTAGWLMRSAVQLRWFSSRVILVKIEVRIRSNKPAAVDAVELRTSYFVSTVY
jgi:hypothetical protein